MADAYQLHSSALPSTSFVVAFRGEEEISRPYRFDVWVSMTASELGGTELADAVGTKASLTMTRAGGQPYTFHGVLCAAELVHHGGALAIVRATVVPQLWLLSLSRHSRVFTKKTVREIISTILEDNGLSADDFAFKLMREPATEEHVCQYRESDLAFISRWMEREGLYYYFDHTGAREKLIITDERSYQPDSLSLVRYHPVEALDATAGEALNVFDCRHASLPGSVRLRDWDYANPALDVSGTAEVSKSGLTEIVDYGARFFTPAEGARLAGIRAEELLAQRVVHHAQGNAFFFRAGHAFKLDDHPLPSFNARYFATRVVHACLHGTLSAPLKRRFGLELDDGYHVALDAIADTVQFRAPSRTPWPRVDAVENGLVDGPANSDYAQIDSEGRYALKLHFDESALKDGKATTWVRMLQPHGGDIEGWHFPLRKGTEVLVTFLGGDPDRPIISGVVPNALTPSAVTAANYTKNVIQTGGNNRLELEDQHGAQWITLSTPYSDTYMRMGSPSAAHELVLNTEDNAFFDIGVNFDLHVGGNWESIITADLLTFGLALKNEVIVGVTNELLIGGEISTVVGASISTKLGLEVKLCYGLVIEQEVALKVSLTSVSVENDQVSMQTTSGPNVETSGVHVSNSGTHIFS